MLKPSRTCYFVVVLYVSTVMRSHLKFGAGVADLIDVRQRASIVRRPWLRQTKLLDLLKLHLSVKRATKINKQKSGFMNSGYVERIFLKLQSVQIRAFPSHHCHCLSLNRNKPKPKTCGDQLTGSFLLLCHITPPIFSALKMSTFICLHMCLQSIHSKLGCTKFKCCKVILWCNQIL